MKPVEFPEQNVIYAKDQPEYLPLPVMREPNGDVTSCWALTWRERVRVLFTGRVWVTQKSFNKLLQPILLRVDDPFGFVVFAHSSAGPDLKA